MKKIKLIIAILVGVLSTSCSKYLDIVPDNVASIESAFTLRSTALRYLSTCYWYMPVPMNYSRDPAVGFWGGETWAIYPDNEASAFLYARGQQGAVNPYFSFWTGTGGGKDLFQALRDCNIFLDNIGKVQDIEEVERRQWIAEAKFLKAYYHFYLLRMYGPIPLIKENFSIGEDVEVVKRYREPIDECVDYIITLLDEAIPDLPLIIMDQQNDLGRVTSVIAGAIKAKILVTAASPLFNGNTDYAGMVDQRGKQLFNQVYDEGKWAWAVQACEEALSLTEQANIELYEFVPGPAEAVSAKTKYQMSLRNVVTERWNSELIWGWPNEYQTPLSLAPLWDPDKSDGVLRARGSYGPSIEFVEVFYTKNGVPISEDKTWDYTSRYNTKVATAMDQYEIENGYTTAKLNFDRENRFYASVGFDGGVWYGQGRYDDNNPWVIKGKLGQHSGKAFVGIYSPTGYWHKKNINYKNTLTPTGMDNIWYPTPIMRLADLYLLYAEAKNEALAAPDNNVYEYVNRVRARSGLATVQDAWTQFSNRPTKYTTKTGMREIIQREREIELAFEGQRTWDMKRWKRAEIEFSKPISGWTIDGSTIQSYYVKILVQLGYQQEFLKRNYFDPIKESAIITNENTLQNPGW